MIGWWILQMEQLIALDILCAFVSTGHCVCVCVIDFQEFGSIEKPFVALFELAYRVHSYHQAAIHHISIKY